MDIELKTTTWAESEPLIRSIREQVFILEQKIPAHLEWEQADKTCVQLLAFADGQAVGTGRLLEDGTIGRLAVLAPWRGKGIGKAMVTRLLDIAVLNQLPRVQLNAQKSARVFYESLGFQAHGEYFLEADIPHIRMTYQFTP